MDVGAGSAQLRYDSEAVGCQTLDSDFAATIDQQPVYGVDRGRLTWNGFSGERLCAFPLIAFNVPPRLGGVAVLEATAGGERIAAEVKGMGQSIDWTVVPAGGQVHPGDRVQIQLGAMFERVSWSGTGTALVRDAGSATADFAVAAPSPTGVMDVTLPASLPPGLTELRIIGLTTPEITRCEGAPSCRWGSGAMSLVLDAFVQVSP